MSQFVSLRSTADILNSGWLSWAHDRIMTCWANAGVDAKSLNNSCGFRINCGCLLSVAWRECEGWTDEWMSRRMRDRGHVCCVYLVSVMLSQLTLKNAERACLRKIAFFFWFPFPTQFQRKSALLCLFQCNACISENCVSISIKVVKTSVFGA